MPIKSKAQRRFLWATDPELAQEFEDKTPKGKKLPEHVKKHTHNQLSTGSYGVVCNIGGGKLGATPEERNTYKSEAEKASRLAHSIQKQHKGSKDPRSFSAISRAHDLAAKAHKEAMDTHVEGSTSHHLHREAMREHQGLSLQAKFDGLGASAKAIKESKGKPK